MDSIINNGYPLDLLEILVVDGQSTDGTREIVKQYEKKCSAVKYIENPKRILASAWNIGIKNGKGDIIMALNAHGVFRKGYISSCIEHLNKYDADYVGGIIVTLPRQDVFLDKAVVTVLSHPFGVGNSYFRIGLNKARWADTAAFGGYRKKIFQKTGLFNEELARSQDMEFHLRLKRAGCKILLAPDMICDYYIRSNFRDFVRDSFVNGYWTLYPLKFAKIAISWRHLVPFIFVFSLLGSAILSTLFPLFGWLFMVILCSYLLVNIYFSQKIAGSKRDIRLFFIIPLLFTILHIGYGMGAMYAGIKVLVSKMF
jgi:GT2 family glycosyltransferase